VIVAENGKGRGILGIIDGGKPSRFESSNDVDHRKALLRKFGTRLILRANDVISTLI